MLDRPGRVGHFAQRPPATAAEPSAAIKAELQALDAARAAAILSDEEYAQKKAALAGPALQGGVHRAPAVE